MPPRRELHFVSRFPVHDRSCSGSNSVRGAEWVNAFRPVFPSEERGDSAESVLELLAGALAEMQ